MILFFAKITIVYHNSLIVVVVFLSFDGAKLGKRSAKSRHCFGKKHQKYTHVRNETNETNETENPTLLHSAFKKIYRAVI